MIQQERIIEECVDELIELIDNSRTPAFGGEDAIFCSPAPRLGSADFRIISFNDILLRLEKLKTL